MPHVIHRQRPAMGTWFEARLVGDDHEHLGAVAEAVLDEVERIERLLSRFDQRSEVARINREAAHRAVQLDFEVLGVLQTCRRAWERTDGYFDVTAPRCEFAAVAIDPEARTVRFEEPGLALDLGGIGKGYALDRGAEIVAAHGVGSAFLHGGTSSILAIGCDEAGQPWPVSVRDPLATADRAAELFRVCLSDRGFSCSATLGPGQQRSDLVDPARRAPLAGNSACIVVACNATAAEFLSTALLCMGKEKASQYVARYAEAGRLEAAWIDGRDDRTTWAWFTAIE
jgi:thiamine biosynthesis lipoprotein